MGYYVGRARVDREHRWLLVGRGLLAAIVMHGLYDLPLMLAGADAVAGPPPAPDAAGVNPVVFGVLVLLWFATVIGGWLWTLRLVRHTRHAQAPHASHAPSARPLEPMVSPGGAQAVVPMPTVDAGPTMAADASERDSVSAPALSSVSVPASAWPPVAVSASASTPVAVPARSAPGGWARFAAWAGVVGGGTIASAGFLFSALAAVSAASGDVPRENVPYLAIGVLAIGVVPGLIGFAAFALGVRRLNRAR
jgi:hypothetical protein